MSDTNEKNPKRGMGEARDLATFLELVDRWTQGVPDLGYRISLFRGQEDASWLLKPGIARPQYAKRVRPDTEREMLAEFKQRAIPHLESAVDLADADWLAIAQHHAMPTRLLDWTGSSLAALWFAIKRPAVEDDNGELKAAAVWLLAARDTDMIDEKERARPLEISRTKLLKPRHVSRRIAAQDGWFSVHLGTEDGLGMKYISLDTNADFKGRVSFIRIPPDAFGPMRAQLQTAGFNRGVLFPDLEGVAGRITDAILYPDDQTSPGAGNI